MCYYYYHSQIISVQMFSGLQTCKIIVQLSIDLPVEFYLRLMHTLTFIYDRLLFNTVCSQYLFYFIYNQIPPQSEENNILHKRTEIKY